MGRKIKFTKVVASGNDFIIVESHHAAGLGSLSMFARRACDRKFGAGADGLLVLGKSRKADIRMRIFNADGTEAEMCGNGARCAALFVAGYHPVGRLLGLKKISIETKAGVIASEVRADNVRIKLTRPKGLKFNIPIVINGRNLRVNFIDTGVPHAVVFVSGLDKIDVNGIGRQIRFHKRFSPQGANANFVEVLAGNSIAVRTYERGVEDETLACGTGSVASALISTLSCRLQAAGCVKVNTRGKEVLKVYFNKTGDKCEDVWLEGKARIVYKGEYDV